MFEISGSVLKDVYRSRDPQAKKYDFGFLLVIGGSKQYSGSPALVALAAFRAGVDMGLIVAPKRAADIAASFSPNLATYPLKGDFLTRGDLPTIYLLIQKIKMASRQKMAIVIGGGLGRKKETLKAIIDLISKILLNPKIASPIVIDADAIWAIAKKPEILKKDKSVLLTPHQQEFFVLTHKRVIDKKEKEKIDIVKKEAEKLKITILLKGTTDIISDGKEVALNKTGSPYMTVGGTGDVLAGIAGALMARQIDPFLAAQAAAYINGKAGEKVAQKLGPGLTATDIIEEIPKVIL
jgi:NAD(P)H-hydrate epimerase